VPRFVDVDARTCCVSPSDAGAKRGELDALVAVHMFGHVCDVPRLRDAIDGKPIIEDCAQSLGSRLFGRSTGTFGDVAVYSFRSGKYLSVGEGGALFAADPVLLSRLVQLVPTLAPATRAAECRHVVRSYVRSKLRSRPLYGLIGCTLWRAYNRTVSDAAKSPLTVGAAFRTDVALARRRAPSLESAIRFRRSHADLYAAAVPQAFVCAETRGAFFNRSQFPLFLCSAAQRDAVAAHLFARGVDASRPYHDIARVARQFYGYRGDCPEAERVSGRVLVIPNHEQLTPEEVQHIVRSVGSALEATAAAGLSRPYIRIQPKPPLFAERRAVQRGGCTARNTPT
jgi:dTDP-4-amino-4,6-dideoxygalactose transaminase